LARRIIRYLGAIGALGVVLGVVANLVLHFGAVQRWPFAPEPRRLTLRWEDGRVTEMISQDPVIQHTILAFIAGCIVLATVCALLVRNEPTA
jgi:hypothetical protein